MSFQTTWNFYRLVISMILLIGISNAEVEITALTRDQNATLPMVALPQGNLQGTILATRYNRSFSAFQGIPYAEPPTGKLRFSSPVPANAWNGTLNASMEGNSCPQSSIVGEEDCLYLNVYTPQLPESDATFLLPVMVYIHGGSFESGSGNSDDYGPGHLLDAELLLVTINYRLGPLGFLSTGDEVAPGNWGLKDQVLALQWVQNNIAYFGGNPNQVTIFGQSAGAASVQLLALSDSTIGLFQKSISQSGAVYGCWPYRPRSSYANLALQLGEIFNCPTNTSSLLIDCLREVDASEIINTKSQFQPWNSYPLIVWGPTDEPDIDGAFLTDAPENLLAAGKIRDLPTMTGIVRDEAAMLTPGASPGSETFQEFLDDFDQLLPIVLQYSDRVGDTASYTAALKEFYFNNDLTGNRTEVWTTYVDLAGDFSIIYPVYKALQKHLAFVTNASYFYSFEYRGTFNYYDLYGFSNSVPKDMVVHNDELLYLFPQLESAFGVSSAALTETDIQMMDTMVQLWTSFAINGTPTTSSTTWSPYSADNNYFRIGNGADGTLELQYNFLPERMQFWDKLTAVGSGNTASISPFNKMIFILLVACQNILSLVTRRID